MIGLQGSCLVSVCLILDDVGCQAVLSARRTKVKSWSLHAISFPLHACAILRLSFHRAHPPIEIDTEAMSLFGSSPPESGPKTPDNRADNRSSLFDDEAPTTRSSGGLFNDGAPDQESPWSMPTAKRQSRGDVVKSLLDSTDVPELYVDSFDILSASEHASGGGQIKTSGVKAVLDGSRIGKSQQDAISKIVARDGENIGRNEFNVLLALIGLAQEGEELSLDTVDERRKSELAVETMLRVLC